MFFPHNNAYFFRNFITRYISTPIQILIFFSKTHNSISWKTATWCWKNSHKIIFHVPEQAFTCPHTTTLSCALHKGMCVSQTNCQLTSHWWRYIYSWSYHSHSWFHHHPCINDAFVCHCIILATTTAIILTCIYNNYLSGRHSKLKFEGRRLRYNNYLTLRFSIPNLNFYL